MLPVLAGTWNTVVHIGGRLLNPLGSSGQHVKLAAVQGIQGIKRLSEMSVNSVELLCKMKEIQTAASYRTNPLQVLPVLKDSHPARNPLFHGALVNYTGIVHTGHRKRFLLIVEHDCQGPSWRQLLIDPFACKVAAHLSVHYFPAVAALRSLCALHNLTFRIQVFFLWFVFSTACKNQSKSQSQKKQLSLFHIASSYSHSCS